MKYTTLAILSSVFAVTEAVTGQLGDAPAITTNPAYAAYEANLGDKNPRGIKGYIQAATDQGGAVIYHVNFTNLPTTGGPFMYHLHVDPVPDDGNCTKTLAHLDPFIRGETPICDPTQPQTCQVGDLSGKYGAIPVNTTSFQASFVDPYATLIPGLGSFFGNRSFVLHFANKTRIGCANFISIAGANYTAPLPVQSSSSTSSSAAVASPTASSSAPKLVLPNAPGYAGGASSGSQGTVTAPTEGNTAFLPNNGLSPGGASTPNTSASKSGSNSTTPIFTGAATSLTSQGSWAAVAVAAVAGVVAMAL